MISNFDNLNELYFFKICNLENPKELALKNNLSISLKLKKVGKINGKYVGFTNTLNQKNDLDNNVIYDYANSFDFYTDQKIDEKFYFFSLKEQPENLEDFYYSFNLEDAISPEDDSEHVFTISLKSVSLLKEINNNFLTFEFIENDEEAEIENIRIRFKNYGFINEINFFGELEDDNNNILPSKIKPDSFSFSNPNYIFVPNIINPIFSNNKNLVLYSNFWEKINLLDLKNLLPKIDNKTKKINLKNFFLSTFAVLLEENILKCLWVNKVLSTGFAGFSEDEKKNFKENVFNGTDQSIYIDKIFNDLFNTLNVSGFELETKRLANVIIMLSESLKSRYAWKNGMNTEHKIGLPFFIDVVNYHENNDYEVFKRNVELHLNSNWFYFDNQKIEPVPPTIFDNNLKQFEQYVLTLPSLPDKLDDQTYSNSPVDFNTKKSTNLNFLNWSVLNKEDFLNIFDKFEKPNLSIELESKATQPFKVVQFGKEIRVFDFLNKNVFDNFETIVFNFSKLKQVNDARYVEKLTAYSQLTDFIEAWVLERKSELIPRGYKIVKNSSRVFSKNGENSDFIEGIHFYKKGSSSYSGGSGGAGQRERVFFEFYISFQVRKIEKVIDKSYKNDWVWNNPVDYFYKVFKNNMVPKDIEINLFFNKNNYFNIKKINYLEIKSLFINEIKISINNGDFKSFKLLSHFSPQNTTTIIKL
ncbi:hypothetical protein [Metamycoplasma gateae]|uniref:Uncharacterized protein n=1 Tax=Metamycoplasma gateae TaxID=35769 RepID=A0ABZ2AHC5_9BACT|nr:hypothetical protein V2E26_02625 [Metamycoplasma gateae]